MNTKPIFTCTLLTLLLISCNNQNTPVNPTTEIGKPTIVIHGGAGSIYKEAMSDAQQALYERSLKDAVDRGYQWLLEGKSGDEVVMLVIERLESDSLFNSGVGAVVTADGEAELDASIMRGNDLNAGAIAGVKHIEHPIRLAKLVMDSSKHVMLSGQGAERYGFALGLDSVDNQMFITNNRRAQYQRVIEDKMGTVGVVVLDQTGNLAAGTSTGGMMMKEYGRIGDSPIIGAGTYADNNGCAVSCTGHGEYFIRHSIAHQLNMRVRQGGNLEREANRLVFETLNNKAGAGGLIALARNGEYTMPFNTQGMFRGMRNSDTTFVAMFSK